MAMTKLLAGVEMKDTTNQAWADDTSSFGHRMLQKMGWKQGKGLGKDESGMIAAVKLTKRIDARGLGAEADPTGNSGWAEQQQTFAGVLATLNSKYGNCVGDLHGKEKKEKKSKKSKNSDELANAIEETGPVSEIPSCKRSRRSSDAAAGDEVSCINEDPQAAEVDAVVDDAARAAKYERKMAKRARRAEREKHAEVVSKKIDRGARHRVSRARYIKSKNVAGYSSKDLAAVLGIIPSRT
jgi:hypothetical protein